MIPELRSRQAGLTLIESLIALLVLSIGLVGLGALMLTSLKNVHSSSHYSVASAIALDFEEQLWSRLAVTTVNNAGNLGSDGCLTDTALTSQATALATEWASDSPSSEADWTNAPRFNIPDLAVAVGTTSTRGVDKDGDGADDVYWKTLPLTLTWTEGRFSNEGGQETYTASVTLPCRPVFL